MLTQLLDESFKGLNGAGDDLAALRSIPGVVAATTAQSIPISGSGWGEDLYNSPEAQSNESINFGNFMVDEQGLDTFGLELVAGRNFRPEEILVRSLDDATLPEILIVSQALADELFPDGDALGKTVWDEPNGGRPMQIIGIYDTCKNQKATAFDVIFFHSGSKMSMLQKLMISGNCFHHTGEEVMDLSDLTQLATSLTMFVIPVLIL